MSRIVSLHLRPRYAETDQMGIVYYANYLVWFECGRSEYMRAVGMPYTELERRGYYFPVTEFQCRLTASARYDEEITVHTRVQDLKSRRNTCRASVSPRSTFPLFNSEQRKVNHVSYSP